MDLKGIPEDDYKKLARHIGEAEAEELIKKYKYNYQAVVMKILRLEIRAFLKAKPLLYTVLFVVLVIIFFILMFPDIFIFWA